MVLDDEGDIDEDLLVGRRHNTRRRPRGALSDAHILLRDAGASNGDRDDRGGGRHRGGRGGGRGARSSRRSMPSVALKFTIDPTTLTASGADGENRAFAEYE